MPFVELRPKHCFLGIEWGGRIPIKSLEPNKHKVYLVISQTGGDFYGKYAKITPEGQIVVHSFSANTDIVTDTFSLEDVANDPRLAYIARKIAYIP